MPATPGGTPAGRAASMRRPRTIWWYIRGFFLTLLAVLFCVIIVTAVMLKSVYDQLSKVMPDVQVIDARTKAEPTRIYAADGSLLAEFRGEQRDWIPIEDLQTRDNSNVRQPGYLIKATLAIEDARFYTHAGMDAKRILGAAWANFRSGNAARQGGSTITEQLAKNIYLTRKKTYSRRLQTAMLALQLEKKFSKDEILQLYLNEIYYGNRAYGCEAAAQIYFNRPAGELTLAQAALLAALPNSPSLLDPFEHFDRAQKRQRLVLKEMLEHQELTHITQREYEDAVNDESVERDVERAKTRFYHTHSAAPKWRSPYFVSYVRQYLQKQYDWSDDYLNKGGLKIYTTLDPRLQQRAEQAMRDRINELGHPNLQGAVVCIDPWTGHVLAMVGGRDYYDSKHNGQWNRAVQARRQPGSTFKPYIYATALEAGDSPDSTVRDERLLIGKHEIKNYDFKHRGTITYKEAIGMSNNVAATKVLLKTRIENVIQKAHLMGIQSSLQPYPSLALGASEVTVLEHVSAFGVFATRGLRAEPTPIERIDTDAGETVVEHGHPVHGARVLSQAAGDGMWEMLRYVVTSGTGRSASIRGVEVIGKTGTTSSNHDVWFMGASKDLVCGVWLGYDSPNELVDSSGGRWCAPLWRDFMRGAIEQWRKRNPIQTMVEDAHSTEQRKLMAAQSRRFVRVKICQETGLLANASCPQTRIDTYSLAAGPTGGAPTQHCYIHIDDEQSMPALSDTVTLTEGGGNDLGYDQPVITDDDRPRRRRRRKPHNPDAETTAPGGAEITPGEGESGGGSPRPQPENSEGGGEFAPSGESGGGAHENGSQGGGDHDEGLARHSG